MTDKFVLDFYSGSHGHFLEYLINTWIFQIPKHALIFNPLGASHNIRDNPEYMSQRIVVGKHYTEFNREVLTDPEKVVRVTINKPWANWVFQINVAHRAGDVPISLKMLDTPTHIREVPHLYRNEWFSKLNDQKFGYPVMSKKWRWPNSLAFEFPIDSLFSISTLYKTMHACADFFNMRFVPDQELIIVWEEFLKKNQGWQTYTKCINIVNSVVTYKQLEFNTTILEQAVINSLLVQTHRYYTGDLYTNNDYPTNTDQLRAMLTDHHNDT
jgi:hypothetical protein